MSIQKVVGFGDSWVWGDELLDPDLNSHPRAHPNLLENRPYREHHCFLGQIAKHLGVPAENFGIAGGSLQSTQWNFLWWLDHEHSPQNCLIIVGLTGANRFSFINPQHRRELDDPEWNRYVHSAWPNQDPEWRNLIQRHLVLTDGEITAQLNYQQAVMFFDGVAARHSLDLYQFDIMRPPMAYRADTLAAGPDLRSWLRQQPGDLFKPMGHPNESGHTALAQYLISQIESCKI